MAHGDGGEGFPANAMIASDVLDVLRQRGVLRRTGLAETIRNIAHNVQHTSSVNSALLHSARCVLFWTIRTKTA